MTPPSGFRRVGRTTLALPALGLGAAPLGNLYASLSDEMAAATLDTALDLGLRYIDTAPYYGFGLSERRVGDAVRGRSDVILSTKVGRLLVPAGRKVDLGAPRHGYVSPMPFSPIFDYSYSGILRSHEESLQRLGVSRVDIVYVHDIGRMTHKAGHGPHLEALVDGGGLRALRRLRDEGAVSAIGIGVNEVEICMDLLRRTELDLILLAGRYTLLDQGALPRLMPLCAETGTSLVLGGPYNSGILTGVGMQSAHYDYASPPPPIVEQVRRIAGVCARHDVPIGAAALQFAMAHPAVASVVPGLASPAEVRETMAWASTPIPPALWCELKDEGLLAEDAPVPAHSLVEAGA